MLDAPSDADIVFDLDGLEVVMSPMDHKRSGEVFIDWLGDGDSGMFWIRSVPNRR